MLKDDPIAELIPWYANGTLEAEERERVEVHLPQCASCYALLARARSFRRLAPIATEGKSLEHVSGHLLVQYAETPDQLDTDTKRFVSTHLSGCEVCAGALEILQDMSQGPIERAEGEVETGVARGPLSALVDAVVAFWRGLSRTVLQPAPALVYLGALVVIVAIVTLRGPVERGDASGGRTDGTVRNEIAVLPPAIRLPEEITMRGSDEAPLPQVVAVQAGTEKVVVELMTSIDRADLDDPDAQFLVEIAAGEHAFFSMSRRGADFDRRGHLQLLLDPATLIANATHTIRIVFEKEGDVRNGELLYRKSFRLGPSD